MKDRAVYEFGDIRVDLGRMTITRAGTAISLEPKAFDVLVHLIANRDRLVTKDELLETVWAGTFVTPNVLTRAIAQIRKALGDEADDSRYIETLARRGYRFIPALVVTGVAPAADVEAPSPPPRPPEQGPPVSRPSGSRERVMGRGAAIAIAAVLIAAALAGAALLILRPRQQPAAASPEIQLKRLTNRRGINAWPALSADGRALVYASDATGAVELYLASLTPGVAEVQLTRDGGQNVQPAWSPDGQWIAYHSRKRGGVWILPATGGTPQQLTDFGSDPAWAPDSRTLVFTSDAGGLAGQSNLWTVDRDGANRKPFTQIGTPAGGHRAPAWSHDGRFIAFIVARGAGLMQLWVATVATGEQRLIDASAHGADPGFAPGDRAVLWGGTTATGNGRLFRRALDDQGRPRGETETVFPLDASDVESVNVAANGTLVFAARQLDANLWAVDVGPGRASEPVRVTDDVARSTHPAYASDGRIAYQQMTVGSESSIWIVNDDGTGRSPVMPGTPAVDPQWDLARGRILVTRVAAEQKSELAWIDLASRRLTPLGISARDMLSPSLSPDARSIAFHTIEKDGRMNVWTTTLDGKRTKIASEAEAVSYPVWSPDGRWLAVEVKRGDTTQVAVVPATGGPLVQLTDVRGQSWPQSWAPDNDRIVFAGQRDGVWNVYTVSRVTRAETRITNFTSVSGYVRYPVWSPRGSRVVFERAFDTSNVWTATLPRSQPPQ